MDNLTMYVQRCELLRRIGRADEVEQKIFNHLKDVYTIPTEAVLTFDFGQVPFENDFSKKGFKLIKNSHPLIGRRQFDCVPILKMNEDPIKGDELFRRVKELGADIVGQTEAEKLLKKQELIPEERRGQIILFPGTVWEHIQSQELCVPYIRFDEKIWTLDLLWTRHCGNIARLLVPRKSNVNL